jgi:hypothetical protein
MIFPCQHDGDLKPLYLFFGEMGYWNIAASVPIRQTFDKI